MKKLKNIFRKIFILLFSFAFLFTEKVNAIEKIEGGDITFETLGKIIKNLATQIQVLGIIISFICVVIFVIQFIMGDDDTKQRKKKTIIYTLAGVAVLILVPSLINFIIDTLGQ